MVNFSGLALSALAFVPTAFSMTRAGVKNEVENRRLSYEQLALYSPNSQITDHAAIDLDQKSIETQLALDTDDAFANAKAIYQEGGHSKSYALIKLSTGLTAAIAKKTPITGVTENGTAVSGKAYSDYSVGDTEIKVQYTTSDIQATYVTCQVGALALVGEEMLDGCFATAGTVTIDGVGDVTYSYDQTTDNKNGRTIQGFSTAAEKKLYNGCPGCPYPVYKSFYDYYGEFDYANQWVLAALDGTETNFLKGNADFSKYGFDGRREAAKKGTVSMNIFMYVIREFYDAIDDCSNGCIDCNDDPVHAWDEGVAFFVGSSDSKLGHVVGNKRCANYMTCGTTVEDGTSEGIAKNNYDLMDQFNQGQYNLLVGNCASAKTNADRIVDLMTVPIVQGTLRYSYKVDKLQGAEKEKAEGAVFAAAVLPIVHACGDIAADVIYDNMKVGAEKTTHELVKLAFEDHYECMGITCDDVGGLWNKATDTYYEGAEPCKDNNSVSSKNENALAIGLGSAGAVLGVIALLFVGYMIRREKSGKPMFQSADKVMA